MAEVEHQAVTEEPPVDIAGLVRDVGVALDGNDRETARVLVADLAAPDLADLS